MSKVKRTLIFILAVITCMTFCLVNSSAITYYDGMPKQYFSSTSAYAFVSISNWATEENDTDLKAITVADSYDYRNVEGFFYVVAMVDLTVELDDHYTIYDTSGSDSTYDDYTIITAEAYGTDCLNYEDHYGIIGFSSNHEVQVYFSTYDEVQDVEIEDWYRDGSIIHIGTTS